MKVTWDLSGLPAAQQNRLKKSFRKMGHETRDDPPPKQRKRVPAATGTRNEVNPNTKKNNRSAPNKQARPSARQVQLALNFLAPRGGR
jgi:hypothetical protein